MSQKQPTPVAVDVLGFIEKCGELLSQVDQVMSGLETAQKGVLPLAKEAADALSTTKLLDGTSLINEGQVPLAVEKLATHAGALEVLGNVLGLCQKQIKEAKQQVALASQGSPAPRAKQAAASPNIERRTGPMSKSAAWDNFAQAFGVTPATQRS